MTLKQIASIPDRWLDVVTASCLHMTLKPIACVPIQFGVQCPHAVLLHAVQLDCLCPHGSLLKASSLHITLKQIACVPVGLCVAVSPIDVCPHTVHSLDVFPIQFIAVSPIDGSDCVCPQGVGWDCVCPQGVRKGMRLRVSRWGCDCVCPDRVGSGCLGIQGGERF